MLKAIFLYFAILFGSVKVKAIKIISLGQSCTVAGAMRDCGIREVAYPFDWVVAPFDALYRVLEDDFEHFLQEDSLTVRLSDGYGILDYYGFHFVHDFPSMQPNDSWAELNGLGEDHFTGGVLRDDWRSFVPSVRTKYFRRIERLRQILSGTEKVYLIRHLDLTQNQAVILKNLLHSRYPNLDFTLVVIGKSDDMRYEWDLESIKNFYLDTESDLEQWKNIFKTLGIEIANDIK